MAVQERKDLLLINFDHKNFFLGSKKNCMVINYKLNSSVFQKRLVKLLLTKLQIFTLKFDHRNFFIWGIKNFVWWY